MPGPRPRGEQPAGAGAGECPTAALVHLEQAAQEAQLRRYGILAHLAQRALEGTGFAPLARESLVLVLEELGLAVGALLERQPDEALKCVARAGVRLALDARLEPAALGPWRELLAAPAYKVVVLGAEAPVPLSPLGGDAAGVLVRMPDERGEPLAVLAIELPPGQRLDADALALLQALGHLLAAALLRERRDAVTREEMARLRALLDHAPAAIALKDLEGRFIFVNRRVTRYLRMEAGSILGRRDAELFTPRVAALMAENERTVLAARRPLEFEEETELPGGTFTFKVLRFPLLDAQGNPYAVGVVATDITELVRVERELRHSHEQLRQLVDGLMDHAIVLLDTEGRVVGWSRGAERLKGYRAEEMIGRFVGICHDGEAARPEVVKAYLERAAREGRVEMELCYVRKDGTRFLGSDVWLPLRNPDGTVRGFSEVTRDVTAERRAEELLRWSEQRYRLMSRATQVSIWDWDPATNRLAWGEGALARFGYEETEDAGDLDWWEVRIHPEDREECLSRLLHTVAQGETRYATEYRFLRADGTYAWVGDVGYVVYERGRAVRMIGAMTDITRERRVESERSRLYREAQEAIHMRDEFLSVASHELKTPLTTLALHLQALRTKALKDGPDFTPELVARKLALADQQVGRLATLINDLLDVSRLQAGKMELRFETVSVASLLSEVVERQRDALHRSGAEVRLLVHDQRPARVDPLRLEQVLNNLLSNAAKYGQGRPIDVELDGDEDSYTLRVTDRGIGIPKEDQARIFQRFERAVSERHYGGLGLGLWITSQIVMNLGGSISVTSEPGKGATFEVQLPRFPAEASLTRLAETPVAT